MGLGCLLGVRFKYDHYLGSTPLQLRPQIPVRNGYNSVFLWDYIVHKWGDLVLIPSGKRLHNYGKSAFFMGKITIPMVIFHSYVTNYQAG